MEQSELILLIAITALAAVIGYLKYKVTKLEDKVDLFGGLLLALAEAVDIVNQSQKQISDAIEEILAEEDIDEDEKEGPANT